MSVSHIAPTGILLAAGRGRRMGKTKQLLPWPTDDGEKPLVAAAFDAIAGACREMVVVLGHDSDAVAAALGGRAFRSATSDPDAPMYESIRAGLHEVRRCGAVSPILLQPADHPAIGPETLGTLFRAAADCTDRAVIPEHDGNGGHPILIPAPLIDDLLQYDGSGGLRAFWDRNRDKRIRVPVDDPFVVLNVNKPADLMPRKQP